MPQALVTKPFCELIEQGLRAGCLKLVPAANEALLNGLALRAGPL